MLRRRRYLLNTFVLGRSGGFSPRSLFAAGEQGAWYDPSDLTTLYQDAAGTTPVTAAGQVVGLVLDKSRGLVLGAELVTNGGFDSDTSWTKGAGVTIGSGVASFSAVASGAGLSQITTAVSGVSYVITATISGYVSGAISCRLTSGTFVVLGSSNGTFRVVVQAGGPNLQVFSTGAAATLNIDNISVRELPGNHATQSGATSVRPIYRVDAGGRGYLEFDGIDDWLQTSTITPGANKVAAVVGLRKISDAAAGAVLETSATSASNAGTVALLAPSIAATTNYLWRSFGSVSAQASANVVAPATSVVTGLGDIAGDVCIARVNGAVGASVSTDQGTGNYAAHPLYIGRRAGTSTPFNGRLYGLILRFSSTQLSDALISTTERWMNRKTGAF